MSMEGIVIFLLGVEIFVVFLLENFLDHLPKRSYCLP
jgi:hypothetical protein